MEIRVKVKKKGQLASSHGKDYASGVNQEPLQMQSCEPPAALNVLLWPVVSPKNRVGGSPAFSFVFTFQFIGETLDAPAENGGCGYDFASGVHKYLYAADDPVNNEDPSGNDYGSFDINLSSILAPLSSELYAGTSGQALNFISSLGVFAPAELVDVYTWRTHVLEMATKSRAGHVMMTLHNDTTDLPLLSQFPCKQQDGVDSPYGFISPLKGYNELYSFSKTKQYEKGRPPTHIFEVSIPGTEVQAFNNAIAEQKSLEYWDGFPNGKNETECSTAVCYALEQANILPPTTWTGGLMFPSRFDTLMMQAMQWPCSGITLLKRHAFLSPAGN